MDWLIHDHCLQDTNNRCGRQTPCEAGDAVISELEGRAPSRPLPLTIQTATTERGPPNYDTTAGLLLGFFEGDALHVEQDDPEAIEVEAFAKGRVVLLNEIADDGVHFRVLHGRLDGDVLEVSRGGERPPAIERTQQELYSALVQPHFFHVLIQVFWKAQVLDNAFGHGRWKAHLAHVRLLDNHGLHRNRVAHARYGNNLLQQTQLKLSGGGVTASVKGLQLFFLIQSCVVWSTNWKAYCLMLRPDPNLCASLSRAASCGQQTGKRIV